MYFVHQSGTKIMISCLFEDFETSSERHLDLIRLRFGEIEKLRRLSSTLIR
jgi:hypothetical protein